MKRNQKYVFWTAEQLTKYLIYGNRKAYDFTLDECPKNMLGFSPCGWFGIRLLSLFDSSVPEILAIDYYGGGDLNLENLTDCVNENGIIDIPRYEGRILEAVQEFFRQNDVQKVCVEIAEEVTKKP